MPAVFNKLGIHFQYPENWTLDEQDAVSGQRSVTVYSPGGAFWCIAVHPRWTDPSRLAQKAVQAMREEYEGIEDEPAEENVAGWDLVGYDLNFFYLDLTNTAKVRCLRGDHATYSIFWQAEDREFEQLARVFDAITLSFLSHLKRLRWRD